MKNICRLFVLLGLVLLPLTGTVQPAYAAPVIDQSAAYNSGQLNSYYHWQQGIRTGMAGQLVGIDLWCVTTANPIGVSIWLGTPWQTGPALYTTSYTCTTANQWFYVDLSAAGITLAAEQDFTVGIYSGANTWFGGGDYARGDAYVDGSLIGGIDYAFRTYMEAPATADIQLDAFASGDGRGNGRDVVQVAYTLSGTGGAPFDLGFYVSPDAVYDTGDIFLATYTVTDPALLTDGSHTVDLALGTDIELPTDGDVYPFYDYYVLAIADPAGAIAEMDEANNDAPFAGTYQYVYGDPTIQASVFVHGTDSDDLIVVSPDGGVNMNGALSGPHDPILAFMIYSHDGGDTLDLGLAPYGAYSSSWAGPGDDVVKISPWSTYLDGGDGVDTLSARHFSTQIQVDLAAGTAGWASGNATVLGYENAVGTPFDDTLNGDSGPNMLDGQGGADRLRGFGGNDMLLGGTGYDDIWPGLGLDTIRGDAGVDTVDFFHPSAVGGVQVYLNTTTAYDQEGNLESITGVENVLGTPYADEIRGDWNPNFLFGRDGDDYLSGMSGNDVLWGGLSSIDGQGGDYLDGGAGDDALYGNDNTCTDDASPDQIVGSVGTDTGYGTALDVFWPSTETIVPCP